MTGRLTAAMLLVGSVANGAGLYGVWYSTDPGTLTLPYLTGGQVDVQWSDLQTGPSTYNWTPLDTAMSSANVQIFTVQVDGGTKPSFLFQQVPYTPNWGNTQSNDPLGVLMYWHPTYITVYTGFLAALAAHLNASPYRANILGIRMNFNAVGTEQIDVPAANQKASTWTVPPGVTNGPDWTIAISQTYQATVIDAYVSSFGIAPTSIHVFARVTLDPAILTRHATGQAAGFTYADYFQQGKLYLFFTGGAPEFPLYQDVASLYSMYSTYLLPGLTTGYCEPVSDAWGVTGDPSNPLPHSITPPQWNYWRLLADLALGVSDIALYGADLQVANSAVHDGHNVGADYQSEFNLAFRFAASYAGYHADPVNSPGAWVAFRQSTTAFPASASAYAQLTDFTRFLTLVNPQETVGLDARKDGTPVPFVVNKTLASEQSIGPYNSRFGAWARSIPAGHIAELQLDSVFRTTINSLNPELRSTLLIWTMSPTRHLQLRSVHKLSPRFCITPVCGRLSPSP